MSGKVKNFSSLLQFENENNKASIEEVLVKKYKKQKKRFDLF